MVRSPIRITGIGNNVYTLLMNNKSCTCEKWQVYTLPSSHALAVCRESGTRADTYVPDIYLRETYRRTYEANFHPDLNENYWRHIPYNLTFYPPNMNKEREPFVKENFSAYLQQMKNGLLLMSRLKLLKKWQEWLRNNNVTCVEDLKGYFICFGLIFIQALGFWTMKIGSSELGYEIGSFELGYLNWIGFKII
ncbi:hypothetical protein M9H77_18190 [Catharanthus roseus]|uniref:Uncharacterized protein n=1 Tax=Catharanthus roseus TaxID=4058 RepID=A0ACC0B6S6_CATRO|nr:hypothetical protein M9H77_18190 [Catharanthus roseus]